MALIRSTTSLGESDGGEEIIVLITPVQSTPLLALDAIGIIKSSFYTIIKLKFVLVLNYEQKNVEPRKLLNSVHLTTDNSF